MYLNIYWFSNPFKNVTIKHTDTIVWTQRKYAQIFFFSRTFILAFES